MRVVGWSAKEAHPSSQSTEEAGSSGRGGGKTCGFGRDQTLNFPNTGGIRSLPPLPNARVSDVGRGTADIPSTMPSLRPHMELCRKWATDLELPTSDMERAATVVRARMALEHPSSFLIADESLSGYVCRPLGTRGHRIEAVVWGDEDERSAAFERLRVWHGKHFPDLRLTIGMLEAEDKRAWEDA